MKKTDGFVMKKLEDEYVVLPVGKRTETVNESVALSETAAFIYSHADRVQSLQQLTELVGREYAIQPEEIYGDVRDTVKILLKKGILSEEDDYLL